MNLKLHELKTAAMFCSVDEARHPIMGVRFIAPGRMVATDGRIMAIIETELNNSPSDDPPFTLRSGVIALLPDGRDDISVIRDGNTADIRIPSLSVRFQFYDAIIDSPFPKYHQVLPRSEASETAAVNGAFMSKIERAANLFSGGKHDPIIWTNGKHSALEFFIKTMPNFYGILMPMNPDVLRTANSLVEKLRAERVKP